MKINKINQNQVPIQKMLSHVQSYMDKVHQQIPIKPEQFSCDLYKTAKKCNTPEKENLLNNCLIALADKMVDAKQDNLAGIIYSFLIKFNKDNNPILLKQLIPKALEIAKMQKDSVHIAARTTELCQIYKTYEIHGTNYLSCLTLRKKALNNICSNYDTVGEKFRTISRQMNKKDTYLELLIKTKCEIANELVYTNKQDARKELLSAYKDFQKFSENYKTENEKSYSGLKKYVSIALTDMTLCNDTKIDNVMKKFSCVSKNIINAIKEDAPIENSLFDECFNNMYEEAKKDSLEEKFIYKSLKFVDELENLENPYLSNRICKLLMNKNQNNIRNLKFIIMKQIETREKNQNDFGILHFCSIIQNLFKKDPKAITVNSYLKSNQIKMNALINVINNYDSLSNKENLHTKEEYIKQLIFAKANSARMHKNTNPEYTQTAILEAYNWLKKLPPEYVREHAEMYKVVEFIKQNVKNY